LKEHRVGRLPYCAIGYFEFNLSTKEVCIYGRKEGRKDMKEGYEGKI
jgi:hypothetical protein